jgi:hypothetical protein
VTCPKMNLSYSWLPFSTAKPKANRPRLRGCTDAEMEFHGALLFADMPHAEGHIRPGGIGVSITRSSDKAKEPVPVARDVERPVSSARRKVAGCSKG